MAHILVTGASGFVGAAVAAALAARGDQVTAFDIALSPALQKIAAQHDNVRAVIGEVTECPAVMALFQSDPPDCVFHAAAIVGVVASVRTPLRTFEVNVQGSINLFEAMRLFGTKRMVHMSSEETYGPFESPLITEDHPQNPIHPYGVSKLSVEHLGRGYQQQYGLEVIHLRAIWVYGPDLPRARVPNTFINAALAGEPFHQPFGADFVCDHTYIDDVVDLALLAIDKDNHPYDAYNVGTGQGVSLRQIAEIATDMVPGAQLSVGNEPFRHGDANFNVECVQKGALDISRARDALGYAPKYDIRQGLAAFMP
ncbi:MAG: NAD-dependent epimerase/dehydratase family protein [Alphaproteobacteria bacterium]|jgi:UDP-glucose 4-epimerase|nr:NAD-dependent epimerase/dehydratase family protein [Alphaproteobacteria bacterium]